MKILFFGGELSLRGTSIYTLSLARELKLRGHKVTLISPGGILVDALLDQEIPIVHAPVHGKVWRDWLYLSSYAACARSFDPDLIHVQHQDHAAIGSRLARKQRVPWVLSCHSQPETSLEIPPDPSPRIAAVSEDVRRSLVTVGRVPREWIDVIPNGVSSSLSALEDADAPTTVPVIGTVNRLARDRGIEEFLRAARSVLDAGVEARFLVIGEGPAEFRLRKLSRQLDLTKSLTFALPRARVGDLFRPMDVFVSASMREGHGILVLSAMAEARPVIATGVGGVLSIVSDGNNGLLVQRGDVEGLARNMILLVKDRELARRLAREGFRSVRENYSLNQMVEGTLDCYWKALREPVESVA